MLRVRPPQCLLRLETTWIWSHSKKGDLRLIEGRLLRHFHHSLPGRWEPPVIGGPYSSSREALETRWSRTGFLKASLETKGETQKGGGKYGGNFGCLLQEIGSSRFGEGKTVAPTNHVGKSASAEKSTIQRVKIATKNIANKGQDHRPNPAPNLGTKPNSKRTKLLTEPSS